MNKTLISVLLTVIIVLSANEVRADGILLSWAAHDVRGVTEQAFNEAKQVKAEQIGEKNLAVRSWADAYLLIAGAMQYKDDANVRKVLVSQLSNQTKVRLENTSRLVIWERITSGEILFEGKGLQVDDDLFTVAGRANWILRNFTKKNFGVVRPDSAASDLEQLQKKWTQFLNGDAVEEYKNPYETPEKGLSEIRSIAALEALIVSLKPRAEKTTLTKDCLSRIYGLKEMPKDNSPASMCDPDTLTNRYVAILTGVDEKHNYDWWKSWWETNKNSLKWEKEKGRFAVNK